VRVHSLNAMVSMRDASGDVGMRWCGSSLGGFDVSGALFSDPANRIILSSLR
jgi:hypothetical protein